MFGIFYEFKEAIRRGNEETDPETKALYASEARDAFDRMNNAGNAEYKDLEELEQLEAEVEELCS